MRGMVDLQAATDFLTTHARVLDRRRLELLLGRGDAAGVRAALGAYRNADGGFGWGLEPDLRVPGSQPAGALHAFETLAEDGRRRGDGAGAVRLAGRGDAARRRAPVRARRTRPPPASRGRAGGADPAASSLHITAAVCEQAHRVPAAAGHPWLERATAHCLAAIRAQDEPGGSYKLKFTLGLLDAIGAQDDLERHARHLPSSGVREVAGGIEGEALRPLDFSPHPGRPLRALVAPEAIEADLDRLAAGQQDDGGWTIDFPRARRPPRSSGAGTSPSTRSRRCASTAAESGRREIPARRGGCRRREPHNPDLFSRVR